MFDTVKGSDWLGDQDAIEVLTHEAPALVRELENMGVIFSRNPEGKIAQRNFGGHSRKRACYAADWTGHALLHGLHEQIVSRNVTIFPEWQMVTLIQDDAVVRGVTAYQISTGKIDVFEAKAVMFGTGGYGRAFSVTSNAHANTGDGLVCTYMAGLPLEDMEFVQFHPTGLYKLGILLSEACRGEGGYLLNDNGDRFMENYAPIAWSSHLATSCPGRFRRRSTKAGAGRAKTPSFSTSATSAATPSWNACPRSGSWPWTSWAST